ncbi:MAG: 4-hydroxy-3-methylbut-2-enyl diphosphate reductase [Chloroflexi bacterium]|nr:4-hydroxy-3-methylbut-2-enyl diphosphate reductase [Chloroflexota bacterium]
MEIIKARDLGFCFGVRHAIQIAERTAQQQGKVDSLGDLVHNAQVVERLAQKGVRIVDSLGKVNGKTVVITAHGVGEKVYEDMRAQGLQTIDATCPLVRKVQQAVRQLIDEGFYVLVFGDKNHVEVRGVLGWARGEALATYESRFDAETVRRWNRVGIVSQTTQDPRRFARFVSEFISHHIDDVMELRIVNTICLPTRRQKQAAIELSKDVDLMIVVGGHHSANTKHLAEICQASGVETHHIETAEELDAVWLRGRRRVGVTAGSSTPDDMIDRVMARLEEMARQSEMAGSMAR